MAAPEVVTLADIRESWNRLGRVFETAFRVEDIAEPLVSFDAERSAADVRRLLDDRRFRVAGVREGGAITGYVEASDLVDGGTCGDHRRDFDDGEVVPGDASLSAAIRRLAERERLFVSILGRVGGIVTWTDLHKPPARMWLFGIITLIEMAFTRMVTALFPDDAWTGLVSAGRLSKAEGLLRERRRRHEGGELRLVDCLQFQDKGQILARDEDARRIAGWSSRKEAERGIKAVATLRDSLAHSQDIVSDGWDAIVRLADDLDRILRVGSTFQEVRRSVPRRRDGGKR